MDYTEDINEDEIEEILESLPEGYELIMCSERIAVFSKMNDRKNDVYEDEFEMVAHRAYDTKSNPDEMFLVVDIDKMKVIGRNVCNVVLTSNGMYSITYALDADEENTVIYKENGERIPGRFFSVGHFDFMSADTYYVSKGHEPMNVYAFLDCTTYELGEFKYTNIDKNDNIPGGYMDVDIYKNGYYFLGVVDSHGKEVVPTKYSDIEYDDDLIIVRKGLNAQKKIGTYTISNGKVFPGMECEYYELEEVDFDKHIYVGLSGTKTELIDIYNSNAIFSCYCECERYESIYNDCIYFQCGSEGDFIIKTDGTEICAPGRYKSIESIEVYNAVVLSFDGLYGIINLENGEESVEAKYADIVRNEDDEDTFAAAYRNQYGVLSWFGIDRFGNIIVESDDSIESAGDVFKRIGGIDESASYKVIESFEKFTRRR